MKNLWMPWAANFFMWLWLVGVLLGGRVFNPLLIAAVFWGAVLSVAILRSGDSSPKPEGKGLQGPYETGERWRKV